MSAYLLTVVALTKRTPEFVEYSQRAAELMVRFGGRYVIRGKADQVLEGQQFADRVVVLAEFPSRDQALAFFSSPEYAAIKPLRAGTGTYDSGVFPGTG